MHKKVSSTNNTLMVRKRMPITTFSAMCSLFTLGSKMLAFYPCSSVQIFHCFYCARRLELSGHYRAVSLLDKRRPGRIFLRLGVAYVHFANTNWISSAIFLSLGSKSGKKPKLRSSIRVFTMPIWSFEISATINSGYYIHDKKSLETRVMFMLRVVNQDWCAGVNLEWFGYWADFSRYQILHLTIERRMIGPIWCLLGKT